MRPTVVFWVVVLFTATGCFSLQPVAGQPLPLGTVLSLSINDAGRVALGAKMGQGISDIEGRLVQKDSAAYVLAVSQVKSLRDGVQVWSGEHVSVGTEFVNVASEKRFSRSRTALLSAATVGVIAILVSQGILGNLSGADVKTPPDTARSIKIPLVINR